MFLLVPAHPGFPGQIPQSRKTVVCVCVPGAPHSVKFHISFFICNYTVVYTVNVLISLHILGPDMNKF